MFGDRVIEGNKVAEGRVREDETKGLQKEMDIDASKVDGMSPTASGFGGLLFDESWWMGVAVGPLSKRKPPLDQNWWGLNLCLNTRTA